MPESHSDARPKTLRYPLSKSSESIIRKLASDLICNSTQVLESRHVIPRPIDRPWIDLSRYYATRGIRGNTALSEGLQEAIPERFAWRHPGEPVDHPSVYGNAVIEGAVAAATLAAEPYRPSSPSVAKVIDEFILRLQEAPATTSLQVATDIQVSEGNSDGGSFDQEGTSLYIGDVEIINVGVNAERYIETELASAGYEVDREYVVSTPGPIAVLVARVCEIASYPERVREARLLIRDAITTIRLATNATACPLVTIDGEPGFVRWIHPHIQPHGSPSVRFSNRAAVIKRGEVSGLESLRAMVRTWLGDDPSASNPLMLAIARLNRSLEGPSATEPQMAVDLAIGLEAALAGARSSSVSLRLRIRAADLLATSDDPGDVIYRDIQALYDLRSGIVHGRTINHQDISKIINRVSCAAQGSYPREKMAIVLDRWRDLLRRAILARAALATAGGPWDLGSGIDIERILRVGTARRAWIQHVQEVWASTGLPHIMHPASKLELPFSSNRG